jgi:hypothetical protein
MYRSCLHRLAGVTLPTRHTLAVPSIRRHRTQRCFSAAPPEAASAQGFYPSPPIYNQYQPEPSYAPNGADPSSAAGPPQDRRYIQWTIYKGAAAMTIKLNRPKYITLPDNSFKVEREGDLRLEFAQALGRGGAAPPGGDAGAANRKYDWANKQAFHLSAVELATLLEEPEKTHQLYHDPNKGRQGEGAVVKKLNWSFNPERGYMVALSVNDKSGPQQKSVNIPVALSRGEFGVLKNLAPNLIWHMLGFSEVIIS